MSRRVRHAVFVSLSCVAALACQSIVLDAGSQGLPDTPSSAAWVDHVVKVYYDSRSESLRSSARVRDRNAGASLTWRTEAEAKLQRSISIVEWVDFVTRYDPVWKGDLYQKDESDTRTARTRVLEQSVRQRWQGALSKVSGSDISDLWTVAFVVDLARLFANNTFDDVASNMAILRLTAIPASALKSLADALGTGPAKAGILVLQHEGMFEGAVFKQAVFDEALGSLKRQITSRDQ